MQAVYTEKEEGKLIKNVILETIEREISVAVAAAAAAQRFPSNKFKAYEIWRCDASGIINNTRRYRPKDSWCATRYFASINSFTAARHKSRRAAIRIGITPFSRGANHCRHRLSRPPPISNRSILSNIPCFRALFSPLFRCASLFLFPSRFSISIFRYFFSSLAPASKESAERFSRNQ